MPKSPPPIIVTVMFSPHLFAHVYDIDTILAALCDAGPSVLNTQTGTFTVCAPADVPQTNLFPLEPLPASYLAELAQSPERKHLTEAEQAELDAFLATATIQSLPGYFAQGRTGGWLRERVKETALDWLDSHDLIPPSMRHINRTKLTATTTSRSITIQSEEA